MAFKLAENIDVWWPAKAFVPSETRAGEYDEQPFKLLLEPLPDDEAKQLDDAFRAAVAEGKPADIHYLLRRVVKGWDEVEGGSGPVPFSAPTMERALQLPWFPKAAYAAYRDMMNGGRLGN